VLTLAVDHNQGAKTPPPETPESEFRRRVWWLILELDIQISIHIGRPLAIRAKLGIERPNLDGVEGAYRQLEQCKLDFKQYALEVLGELCVDGDEPNEQNHETLVELSKMERLQKMEKRLPQMPDLEQNEQLVIAIGDHKIELLALKIMLCCTLVKSAEKQRRGFFKIDFQKDSAPRQVKPAAQIGRPRDANRDEVQSYQVIILEAARSILETFQQVAAVDVSDHYANWNRHFDVYSAAAILAIAALRWEAQSSANITLIANIFSLMTAISDRNPQCHIATVAVTRIGELYAELQNRQLSSTHKQRVKDEASEPATVPRSKQNKRGDSPSKAKGSSINNPKKRKSSEISADTTENVKRIRIEPVSPDDYQSPDDDYGNGNGDYAQYPQQQDFGSHASDLGFNTAEMYQQVAMVSYNAAGEGATCTTTSFDGGIDATHYPQYWHFNDQGNMTNDHGIPYEWYHTPLAGPQPPFLDLDNWQVFGGTQKLQTSTSPYQNNLNNDQMIQMSQAAAAHNLAGQTQYVAQDIPAQAHPTSAIQPLIPLQPSHPQERLGTSQDPGAWEFLQRQHRHDLMRRNSGIAAQMTTAPSEVFGQGHSAYVQSFQIPTTTGPWE
jgi:hypothetical protein